MLLLLILRVESYYGLHQHKAVKIYGQSFFTKTSNLVANNNSIFLSNDKNEFFSLDNKTGILNWKHKY